MRAITIRQPWAWAIFNGKNVENRSHWHYKHRGPFAVHAGLHLADATAFDTVARLVDDKDSLPFIGVPHSPVTAQVGGVIGVASIEDVHWWQDCRRHGGALCSPWAQRDQWHLVIDDARPLTELVELPGRQGLWDVPPRTTRAIGKVISLRTRQAPR